uniref:Anaphase-promoting complex subunit 4 WD40 domain-containing protein n=1 Tax=Percolomonas cosmopolitus TaxID=63605 RepID=A0A7S1KLL8_9EUKA
MNQSLKGHEGRVMVIAWNEDYRKLTSSDEKGLIIVWSLHQGQWVEEMINNRNKSFVRDLKWTSDGQKICIAYEDGMVIVGSVEGTRLWGKVLDSRLSHMEWSPDGKFILFGTLDGDILVHDSKTSLFLHKLKIYCLTGEGDSSANSQDDRQLCGIKWYDGSQGYEDLTAPTLAICYKNGRCQLMTNELDDKPILIDTALKATAIEWNKSGSVLAIAGLSEVQGGSLSEDMDTAGQKTVSVVQLYSSRGQHMRTLRTPGSAIHGISWEGNGLRLAIAVDAFVYFAIVRPDYKWGYFNGTLVYSFTKWERPEHCVVFWNSQTEERHIKYVKRLVNIKAAGDHCLLVTKAQDTFAPSANAANEKYVLILCNKRGSPVDSKIVSVEPKHVQMTKNYLIVASDSQVFVWNHNQTSEESDMGIPSIPKSALTDTSNAAQDDDDEHLFHIDDTSFKGKTSRHDATNDSIVAVTCRNNFLLIARETGTLHLYSLPHITLCSKFVLKCRPIMLSLNCDTTRLSVIDHTGLFTLFALEMKEKKKTKGTKSHTIYQLSKIQKLDIERKECWDMIWAEDNPELYAVMQKENLYVFRGTAPEEPRRSAGYLCEFNELKIQAALLDAIMMDPENPQKEHLVNFATKSLRDTRDLLETVSIEDDFQYVSDNPHPILWKLLAEAALEKHEFKISYRAFVMCNDYHGVQFIKYLKQLDDTNKQNAEILAYFRKFDQAEQVYQKMDRSDLAIELRQRVGDWFGVLSLLRETDGNDELVNEAYNRIGDYFADRQKWSQSVKYYPKSRNYEKLVECYFRLEDYRKLENLIDKLPEGSPLLAKIGQKFASVGIGENAVKAYLRGGDTETAVNTCVELNQWDKAVELAEKYKFGKIETLLYQYANHLVDKNKLPEAIELYQKANRNTDAAKLISRLASKAGKLDKQPSTAKKLYVMAALEIEEFRSGILNEGLQGEASNALEGLLKHDMSTGFDKTLDNAWHGAEAYHYFMLAQRQLYQRDIDAALNTAARLMSYDDILSIVDVYSLIALASYYAQDFSTCSHAFSKLECQEENTPLREQAEKLAVEIFTRHPPKQSKQVLRSHAQCLKCGTPAFDYESKCSGCSARFQSCVVTGRTIFKENHWTCTVCKHQALESAVYKYKTCPMCHSKR